MKKFYLVIISLGLCLSLAACNNATNSKHTNASSLASHKKNTASVSNTSSSASKNSTKTKPSVTNSSLWNTTKAKQLATFMDNWGQKMGQNYDEYTPQKTGDFYGTTIPNSVYNGQMPLAIDRADNQVRAAWSSNGSGPSDTYLIVACYSDTAHARFLYKHVYLFVVYNGQPSVLISQQSQGNEQNSFIFRQTDNLELASGFSQIFAGQGKPVKLSSLSNKGLPVSKKAASQLYYAVMTSHNNTAYINDLITNHADNFHLTDISGQNVTFNMGKDVTRTFPKNTYEFSSDPSYLGMVIFQQITNNQFLIYRVPSHFQRSEWLEDANWSKQESDNYMDNPNIMIVTPSNSNIIETIENKIN